MVSLEASEEGEVEEGAEGSSGLVMLAKGASFLRFCDEAVAKGSQALPRAAEPPKAECRSESPTLPRRVGRRWCLW